MADAPQYWGEVDWHRKGLPTSTEMAAENKRLSLLFSLVLLNVKPRIKLT